MKHRFLPLLLIAALLMGTAGGIPAFAADGWSASYRSYVLDGGYLAEDLEYDSDPGPLFTLYDVDGDGRPELIAFNNLDGHASALGHYVFSFQNGKTVFAGSAGSKGYALCRSTDPSFPGLFVFCEGYHDHTWGSYHYLSNGALEEEWIFLTGFDVEIGDYVETAHTDDPNLEAAYDSRQELTAFYSIPQIRSMGWDAFVSACGYSSSSAPAPSVTGFTDVSPNSYCADAVAWAVENGITNGTSATTFSPDDNCTRQQVVTFLWRAMGAPAPTSRSNPFTDVTGNYAYDAILWAVENGVTNGVSTDRFGPKTVCTREQVVTFLYRALDQPYFENQHNPFSDVSSAGYAYEPILWAVENSVTKGTGTGVFSPRATCTRGQIVTFLYRALS